MNIRVFARKFAVLCALLAAYPQPSLARQVLDKVIAVVNGDIISENELSSYMKLVTSEFKSSNTTLPPKDVLKRQVLNRMIYDKIQEQLAAQSGIEVDSLTISQAIQNIARQQGQSVEQLKKGIESRGINFNEYRDLIRSELTIQRLQSKEVSQDISVSKNDIESYLRSPAGQDQSGTEYKISHILILTPESPTPEALKKVQAQAESVTAKLKAGADFSKMAMSTSAGRQALNGGDLGWRSIGELPTLFVNYVPSMKTGEIVGPIRSAGGFHIIKLQAKRVGAEEVRTETHVRQILLTADSDTASEKAKHNLEKIRAQITKDSDFAKLAAEKSQDSNSAAKGGDLGWITESSVSSKFYNVVSKLRNNEISEPFMTDEGWAIVQVLDRRTQRSSSEAAWNRAAEMLTMRKTNEALELWMKRIRDEAHVEILLPGADKDDNN